MPFGLTNYSFLLLVTVESFVHRSEAFWRNNIEQKTTGAGRRGTKT